MRNNRLFGVPGGAEMTRFALTVVGVNALRLYDEWTRAEREIGNRVHGAYFGTNMYRRVEDGATVLDISGWCVCYSAPPRAVLEAVAATMALGDGCTTTLVC